MRADYAPGISPVVSSILSLWLILFLAGCKTEKSPDKPTVIGTPPSVAYLGVEYYYNFGAYGGETILDYSLTNAPSWLALEDTDNKARQGVIMRGVPGLTGGARGDADLGTTHDINLVTTDGTMMGLQPFTITVKHNLLSLDGKTFTEGNADSVPDDADNRCALPENLDGLQGSHLVTVNEYQEDGSVISSRSETLATRPIYLPVYLDNPSVTPVAVAFELDTSYDPSRCDTGYTAPHQHCDSSLFNLDNAAIGQDVVALGSDSEQALGIPSYLVYLQDESGIYSSGVVTFDPGITECYIRLEIADDAIPEIPESFRLLLTEVRSGQAGLGESNKGVRANIIIEDNEPVMTLRTTDGSGRDTLNTGSTGEYLATITGPREGEVRARLKALEGSTAEYGEDFTIERLEDGLWTENAELVFPAGMDEVPFRIHIRDTGYSNPDLDDRFLLLGVDESYQSGRPGYVRTADSDSLRVSINELKAPLVLSASDEFVATDMAVGHSGRMFVAGYDNLNRVLVRIHDQKGNRLQELAVTGSGDIPGLSEPVIHTARRTVKVNNRNTELFELAVAYSSDGEIAGTSTKGGQDLLVSLYRFDPEVDSYVRTWSLRSGTDGNDLVRSVSINPDTGYLVVAGETDGVWSGQQSSGGFDSFLQRIDTLVDGSGETAAVAWARQAGSPGTDSVVGGDASLTSPFLFGFSADSVNGAAVAGGIDAFFYSTPGALGELAVYQLGTGADEVLSGGIYSGDLVWLLGNSDGDYRVAEDGDQRTLSRFALNSSAGFLLGYSAIGTLARAYTLNDTEDMAEDRLLALTGFDGAMAVAGASRGNFTGNSPADGLERGILARIDLAQDNEDVVEHSWRYQLQEEDTVILALGNYRDDELVALARRGAEYVILLFSPGGDLLTPLN